MRRGLALSLITGSLVALTLAPKVIGAQRLAAPDDARAARDTAAMLQAAGFRTQMVHKRLFSYALAVRGPCRIAAGNAGAAGYMRYRFADETRMVGPIVYFYRDTLRPDFPRVRPVIEESVQDWSFRIAIRYARAPVLAIAATPSCDLARLPWGKLQVWAVRRAPDA